ncbi:MAG: DUF4282 domain-containing protein [Paraperlucidibaca sp.]
MSKHHKLAVKPSKSALFRDYMVLLCDLRFSRYLTVQMLPILYVLLVIGGVGVIGQFVWDAFAQSLLRGITFLVATPVAVLIWASACRAITEFLLAVFRISEDVSKLAGIRPTVDKLDQMLSGPSWISKLFSSVQAFQQQQKSPRATPAIYPEKAP